MIARWRVARAPVMARQDVGGVGRVMRCGGMGRSQGQAPQQPRQAQGQEPVPGVKGSAYHHRADFPLLGKRKPGPSAKCFQLDIAALGSGITRAGVPAIPQVLYASI